SERASRICVVHRERCNFGSYFLTLAVLGTHMHFKNAWSVCNAKCVELGPGEGGMRAECIAENAVAVDVPGEVGRIATEDRGRQFERGAFEDRIRSPRANLIGLRARIFVQDRESCRAEFTKVGTLGGV